MSGVFSFHEAKRAVTSFLGRMKAYHHDCTLMDSPPLLLLQMLVIPRDFFKKDDPEIEAAIEYVVMACSLVVKAFLQDSNTGERLIPIDEEVRVANDWKTTISYWVKPPTKKQARAAATIAGYFAFMKLFFEERVGVDSLSGKTTLSEVIKDHKHFWAIEKFDPLKTLTLRDFLSIKS